MSPRARATSGPCLPLVSAAEELRARAPVLAQHLLAECAASGRALSGPETIGDDIALWLDVLAARVSPRELPQRFLRRARAHAAAGHSDADALLVQHGCVEALTRALTEQFTLTGVQGGRLAVRCAVNTELMGPLEIATGVITGALRPAPSPGQHGAPDSVPGWCLVALTGRTSGTALAADFRRCNPAAGLVVDSRCLTVFTPGFPDVPAGASPYGLARVLGTDAAAASRRALAAACWARHYGLDHLDARHLPPPLADAGRPDSQDFADACLGPLRDTVRHGHLVETLRAYLTHNLCATSAARSLYVHRHTFAHRLRRIRELTGLDLTHPFHRLRAELALLLAGVQEQPALCGSPSALPAPQRG